MSEQVTEERARRPLARLVDAWRAIYGEAAPLERAEMNKVLGDILAGVADDWGRAWHKDTAQALELLVDMGWSTGRAGAIVFERRPAWLGEDFLAALVTEAESRRGARQMGVANYANDDVAVPIALLQQRSFIQWICERAQVRPTALDRKVSLAYIYYDEGERCPLHVDDPRTHELNLLLCLEHPRGAGPQSSLLRVHAPEGVQSFDLEPGDAVLFRADRLPHARTPLAPGERVTLLSVGFKVAEAEGSDR